MQRAVKKLLIVGILLLIGYLVFVHSETSSVIFSKRTLFSKTVLLSRYLAGTLGKFAWDTVLIAGKLLSYVVGVCLDLWTRFYNDGMPSYDISSDQELYTLYRRVERWSGLPWQIFWGIHTEETSLGRNLGRTPVLTVLPANQRAYFFQICRELHWNPEQVYGSQKGAIGPFQFIPETWVRHAVDGNGDGIKDPFNVEDAAYSAANYLLHKGGQDDLQKAVWHYNQDSRYVTRVMRYLRHR